MRGGAHRAAIRTVCLLAALLLGACGDEAGEAVTLQFWAMGREGEVVRELARDFERENPGVRVRVQQVPWSAAHEKLLTAYAGESMPDAFQLGTSWVAEFVALGAVSELGARLGGDLRPDDFFAGAWQANRIGDGLYGVPWYVDTRLVFYRSDLLAEAGLDALPADWAGWRQAMRRVKEAGAEFAVFLPLEDPVPLIVLALQNGAGLLRDDARYADFDSPEFRGAFDFYVGLFEQGLVPPLGGAQIANLYQEFARGTFAMLVTGPWNLGEFRARLPAALQDAWTTAPMPGPDGPGLSLAGGASLAVSRHSRHPEEAWRLVRYLAAPEQQARLFRLTGNLPARPSVWQAHQLDEEPRMRAFFMQLKSLQAPPKIPEWEHIADTLRRAVERVVRGERTADQAILELNRDVDRILAKRRWLLDRAGAGAPGALPLGG